MRVHATFPGLAPLQLINALFRRGPDLTRDRRVCFPDRIAQFLAGCFRNGIGPHE